MTFVDEDEERTEATRGRKEKEKAAEKMGVAV
jgi:hypothetical protein